MGGDRLDTRKPTSKLMLTILAGVATASGAITQVQTNDQIVGIVGSVPEPVSLAVLGSGLIGLAMVRVRRRR
jgi:hypothetical protein